MATVFKTPGVYVQEIPKLPPSVAQVETAIPAFIGYTEKATERGESLMMKPTRISSLLEFRSLYGGDHTIETVEELVLNESNNYAVKNIKISNKERYLMYDSLRLYFDNGGGDCYIVSVGFYGTAPVYGDENDATQPGLRTGVKALEKYDEPTIILFPDAINVKTDGTDDSAFYSLQQMALQQCSKLQDRVGLFDLKENIDDDLDQAIQNYRQSIGINDLKYGGAYTPYLIASYSRDIEVTSFKDTVQDSGGTAIALKDLSPVDEHINLVTNYENAAADSGPIDEYIVLIKRANEGTGAFDDNIALNDMPATLNEKFLIYKKAVDDATTSPEAKAALKIFITFCRNTITGFQEITFGAASHVSKDVNAYAGSESMWRGGASSIIAIDKNVEVMALNDMTDEAAVVAAYSPAPDSDWLDEAIGDVTALAAGTFDASTNAGKAKQVATAIHTEYTKLIAFADAIIQAAKGYKKAAQEALYENHPVISTIVNHIEKNINTLPPSGAVAGVYAKVDSTRGVWKAPANVSLNSVTEPSVAISHEEQANINVDAVAGKSINAIRTFTGKGTLVWGARTLAGNDNEWRYVSVRRFFNMVEESCKKATEPFVFEPNDSNTWLKVQTMIENFLTIQWRQGALQGAEPAHAFYVAVGLGKTMTALDILEGRMIVEIGMAVVRPAEFIILQFSHKLAES